MRLFGIGIKPISISLVINTIIILVVTFFVIRILPIPDSWKNLLRV